MRESPQAREALQTYLALGPSRSTAKVGQQLGKSKDLMDRWSAAHGWVRQAKQYDSERHARERAEREAAEAAERERLRKLRLAIAATEQTIALRRLNGIIKDEAAVAGLEVRDVVALLKSAHDTQRLEYGDATERTEANGSWVVEIVEVPRGTRG